jgi:hypothetical protein
MGFPSGCGPKSEDGRARQKGKIASLGKRGNVAIGRESFYVWCYCAEKVRVGLPKNNHAISRGCADD